MERNIRQQYEEYRAETPVLSNIDFAEAVIRAYLFLDNPQGQAENEIDSVLVEYPFEELRSELSDIEKLQFDVVSELQSHEWSKESILSEYREIAEMFEPFVVKASRLGFRFTRYTSADIEPEESLVHIFQFEHKGDTGYTREDLEGLMQDDDGQPMSTYVVYLGTLFIFWPVFA